MDPITRRARTHPRWLFAASLTRFVATTCCSAARRQCLVRHRRARHRHGSTRPADGL